MKRLLLLLVCAASLTATTAAPTRSNKTDIARNLSIFNSLFKELQTNYVDTIDANKLMKHTIDAMLSQIDPYTEYYPAENQEDLLQISSGQYGGIGAYIMQRDGKVMVSQPVDGSPSRQAGLRHGDIFTVVGGDTVTAEMGSDGVSKRLRGQPGTNVKVQVRRPYAEDSLLTFDIMRQSIKVNPLPYYGVLDDGTGYIRLTTFNEKSANAVRDALNDMRATGRLKSLILDLRGNGGGIIEGAVQIVGLFVPKGTEVVRTKGADARSEKIYKTTRNPIDTSLPMAVLTDGGTASASEIVAGSLQDLDRAVIVGNRSFGKGLVQSSRPLPYDGLLKVTIGRYYIPSGRLIQAIDYSHRNPDGSPARIPDSLTSVYHTRHGREVRDGGGIKPDVFVPDSGGNRLLYNIVSDFWAYDYANRFRAKTPAIDDADTFEITDSIFEDFKAFIDPDKFKYDRLCESGLEYLREAAKAEGYMNDSVAAQFEILAGMLKHDLNRDLDYNRDEIKLLLDNEISERYFTDAEMVKRSIRHDADVDSARAILADPNRYRRLLIP